MSLRRERDNFLGAIGMGDFFVLKFLKGLEARGQCSGLYTGQTRNSQPFSRSSFRRESSANSSERSGLFHTGFATYAQAWIPHFVECQRLL